MQDPIRMMNSSHIVLDRYDVCNQMMTLISDDQKNYVHVYWHGIPKSVGPIAYATFATTLIWLCITYNCNLMFLQGLSIVQPQLGMCFKILSENTFISTLNTILTVNKLRQFNSYLILFLL